MTANNFIAKRIQTIKQILNDNNLDGLIVTNYVDQFYLTQFPFFEDETIMLFTLKKVYCFTRELYVEPFSKYAPEIEVIGQDAQRLEKTLDKVKELSLKRVGFDATKEKYLSGKAMVEAGCVEAASFITKIRERKDEDELSYLRKSNQIAFNAYEYVKPLVKTGMTENQVASLLEQFMKSQGASGTSFPTIVAFGANAANPHHGTSEQQLKDNECVLIDFGCVYKGYCSDITRSWWHGDNEPEEYTKIWNLVDKARQEGIASVKIGFPTQKVDATSRQVIADGNYGTFFTHGTGHGVGLEIHENPYNNQHSTAVLAKGNIVTVEPGIYLPGKYGVRIEDTIAVTDNGAEILTKK